MIAASTTVGGMARRLSSMSGAIGPTAYGALQRTTPKGLHPQANSGMTLPLAACSSKLLARALDGTLERRRTQPEDRHPSQPGRSRRGRPCDLGTCGRAVQDRRAPGRRNTSSAKRDRDPLAAGRLPCALPPTVRKPEPGTRLAARKDAHPMQLDDLRDLRAGWPRGHAGCRGR